MSYIVNDTSPTPRTADQINVELSNLEIRLGQVDGVGLTDASQGQLAKLSARIEGVRTQVLQATKVLESQLSQLQASVTALQAQLNQHLAQ